jgi:PAS domain S-box-containing protein
MRNPSRSGKTADVPKQDLRAVEPSAGTPAAREDRRQDVLLTAAIGELLARTEQLHEATQHLATHNALLVEAHEALADERTRYRELFDLAPDPYLLTDEDGTIVDANARASAFLGAPIESLVGQSLAAFVEQGSRPALRDGLLDPAGAGRRTTELRIVPHGATALDVEATVATLPLRSGGTLLWLLRDITERLGAQRRLDERLTEQTAELEATREQSERERLHLLDLLERLQEGVVAVDVDGNVTYANAAAKFLLRPAPLVEGEPLPDAWTGADLPSLLRSLFTTRPRTRELHVTTDAGRVLTVRGIAALGSETAGLVVTDVSTRERRERAEREFVANAAHELRTPLAAMSGAIEVLQSGAKDDPHERERFLNHIERECGRLERLSTALLLLARAQMGVEAPRLEVVPLRPVLDLVASETHPASGVRLEVSCPGHIAAFANRILVEQAVGNLASNAAKHTRDGTIWLRCAAADRRFVLIEIADTGPGMELDARLRATERFYRSGGAEGFGLGLAIATEAARSVGGRLELDSDPGRGTTARLVLPSAEMLE